MAGGFFGGGSGTLADPFLIEDAHDFNAVRRFNIGFRFKVTKDLNLNTPPYNTGKGWNPIPYFASHIDGNGHKLSGIRMWSDSDPVGLILEMGGNATITNLHFDDFYFEMSKSAGSSLFCFFGIDGHQNNSNHLNLASIHGCSFVGKVNYNGTRTSRATKGFFAQAAYKTGSAGSINCWIASSFRDCYFELENVGDTRIPMFGTMGGANTSYINAHRLIFSVFKCKKGVDLWDEDNLSNFRVGVGVLHDTHLIDHSENEANIPWSSVRLSDETFLSNPVNIPSFLERSWNGRYSWYFPGNTHIRPASYSRNKFLVEAQGSVFSYRAEDGLYRVGASPVNAGMFDLHGFDYIESVPVDAWAYLRREYGTVDIHSYLEKIPGKQRVTNKENLSYSQSLEDKVVMRSSFNYADHNNDIESIRIIGSKKLIAEGGA